MSMIGNLTRIPEHVRVALHTDPERITALLYPEIVEEKKPGFFSRLFGKRRDGAPTPDQPPHTLGPDDSIDLDKTWHALQFLFTGTAWEGDFPACFLVNSGQTVGDVDVGYGPARSFTPIQTKEIAQYLDTLEHAALKERYDCKKMLALEIYPQHWTDEDRDYLEDGLEKATRFVRETAEKDMALLVYIN